MQELEYHKRTKEVNRVGVLIRDLRPSTLTYSLVEFASRDSLDESVTIFHTDWRPGMSLSKLSLMQYRNAYGFKGTLVSTDLTTTKILLNLPNTCRKIFYIWDMYEYQSLESVDEVMSIFCNESLDIIVRSECYKKIIELNFNRIAKLPGEQVLVSKNFDSSEFLNIIKNRS